MLTNLKLLHGPCNWTFSLSSTVKDLSWSSSSLVSTTRAALLWTAENGRRGDLPVVEGGVSSRNKRSPPSESGIKEQYRISAWGTHIYACDASVKYRKRGKLKGQELRKWQRVEYCFKDTNESKSHTHQCCFLYLVCVYSAKRADHQKKHRLICPEYWQRAFAPLGCPTPSLKDESDDGNGKAKERKARQNLFIAHNNLFQWNDPFWESSSSCFRPCSTWAKLSWTF